MENDHQSLHVDIGSNSGEKEERIKYVVPLLVLAVILFQIILSLTTHLSPWKGGGFGMFSVVSKRFIGCTAHLLNGDKLPCAINFSGTGSTGSLTEPFEKSFLHNPSQKTLDKIGNAFLRYEHSVIPRKIRGYQHYVVINTGFQKRDINQTTLKRIELDVFEISFDHTNAIAGKKSLELKGSYATGN